MTDGCADRCFKIKPVFDARGLAAGMRATKSAELARFSDCW